MVSTAGEKALCGCLYGLFWFLRYLHASGEFKRGYCGNDTKSNSYCGRWNYRSGKKSDNLQYNTLHRGAFCQFPFRWIYYYGSNKSTKKETCKTHLCALGRWVHGTIVSLTKRLMFPAFFFHNFLQNSLQKKLIFFL